MFAYFVKNFYCIAPTRLNFKLSLYCNMYNITVYYVCLICGVSASKIQTNVAFPRIQHKIIKHQETKPK